MGAEGITPNNNPRLPLALHLEINPGSAWGPYEMPEIGYMRDK